MYNIPNTVLELLYATDMMSKLAVLFLYEDKS